MAVWQELHLVRQGKAHPDTEKVRLLEEQLQEGELLQRRQHHDNCILVLSVARARYLQELSWLSELAVLVAFALRG